MSTLKHRIAVFPGSFDPFTRGHASVVRRGLALFDHIIIGIGVNERKTAWQTAEQRLEVIRRLYADEPRISVETYADLTVDFARRHEADFILRGVRSYADFAYEQDIAEVNRRLSGIETVVLFTEPDLGCVSSSMVKELAHFGKDIRPFLPEMPDTVTESPSIYPHES